MKEPKVRRLKSLGQIKKELASGKAKVYVNNKLIPAKAYKKLEG